MNKHDGQGLSPRYVAFRVGDGEKTLSECDALPGQRRARKKSRMVREEGLEPSRLAAPDPKSGASAVPPLSRDSKTIEITGRFQFVSDAGYSFTRERTVVHDSAASERP